VIAAEAHDAASAAERAATARPDVIFLDIAMPRGSGLDFAATLSPRPAIIFTTAHPQYAVDAFDLSAVDYLVKPIGPERLARALHRLRHVLARPQADRSVPAAARAAERMAVRTRSEVVFVEIGDIQWIAAEGNYSRIHTAERSYLIRELINSVAARLDPSLFIRVHRSSMVNLLCVRKLIGSREAGVVVELTSGALVRVGASYRDDLERILGGPF